MTATTQSTPIPAHELAYEHGELPKLRSNYGPHLNRDSVGWMRITTPDTPMDEMRHRFHQDGYLYIKSLLPRQDVLNVRAAYFAHLAPTGLLAPNTSLVQGIFNPSADPKEHNGNGATDLPGDDLKVQKLAEAHSLPAYLSFLEHPNLHNFVQNLMSWQSSVLLKRTLLRHNVPGGLSTGIHYDKIFLRAGEAEFLTAWVPFGDCAPQGGGLMYLENSTSLGEEMERQFAQNADKAQMTEADRISAFNVNMARDGQLSHDVSTFTDDLGEGGKRRWLVGDYEAGDVVFHNPYMIHGAIKNEDAQGRIRLATDLRFYEKGSDMDQRWMRDVWKPGDGL